MRIALAGLGAAAMRAHLPSIAVLEDERRVRLVGAADPDPERRELADALMRGVPLFEDAVAMLRSVRSDLLVVAAEPAAHEALVTLGVKYNQHVLCEKPLTIDPDEYSRIVALYTSLPHLGLISVHQYRWSPTWYRFSRLGRAAEELAQPFELVVELERLGTDASAVSPWRSDQATSGGILADHAVHFVALGWTISEDLEVISGWRTCDENGRERAAARLRVGAGHLDVHLSAAGSARHTSVNLAATGVRLDWSDAAASLSTAGRPPTRWRAEALSDRKHVDGLYVPFYRSIAANLASEGWRKRRTHESLTVGGALLGVLERATW